MTPELQAELARRERDDAVEDARLLNPLERIADSLQGLDVSNASPEAMPMSRGIERIALAAEDACAALEEIARVLSPGWKSRTERSIARQQEMLEERRRSESP